MNTIFLLCQCDSLVTTVCGNTTPVVITKTYEVGTNVQDVLQNTSVTLFICVATVIVSWIVMCTILLWKYEVIKAKEDEREFQMTKEKEETQRKQKADLLEKKLQILHDLCYSPKVKDTNIEKVLKSADCQEVLNYLKAIDPTYKPQDSASSDHSNG